MKFILTLLVIAGMVAGWFLLQQSRQEKEEHYWMTELKSHMAHMVGNSASHNPEAQEAPMFKLILFMHEAEASNVNLSKMISDACADLNMDDAATSLVQESIMNDLNTAKQLGVFDDPTNLIDLRNGETAVIQAPGWKGEKLAVVQIVPSVLAPDAAQSLPNLALAPTIVRDAWGWGVTSYAVDRAYQLQRCHFMSKESLDRVVAAKPASYK